MTLDCIFLPGRRVKRAQSSHFVLEPHHEIIYRQPPLAHYLDISVFSQGKGKTGYLPLLAAENIDAAVPALAHKTGRDLVTLATTAAVQLWASCVPSHDCMRRQIGSSPLASRQM